MIQIVLLPKFTDINMFRKADYLLATYNNLATNFTLYWLYSSVTAMPCNTSSCFQESTSVDFYSYWSMLDIDVDSEENFTKIMFVSYAQIYSQFIAMQLNSIANFDFICNFYFHFLF